MTCDLSKTTTSLVSFPNKYLNIQLSIHSSPVAVVVLLLKSACLLQLCLCPDENGKDQGINVRQKVKEMVEFIQDDDRLREERKKAKKNKDKYIGVSSDSMGGGGGSFKNCKLYSVSEKCKCYNLHCPELC